MSMSEETDAGNFTFPDKANMRSERLFFRLPLDRINWLTSSFHWHAGSRIDRRPAHLWFFGLDWFQVVIVLYDACRLRP
jgi:hypothetical protein